MRESEDYDPPADKSSFIEHNLGHLGSVLEQVGHALPIESSPVDKVLGSVNPGVRLLGILAAIVCVNITCNMLFSYIMLAVVLLMMATRPARLMRALLGPVLAVCILSLVVAVPSLLIGQYSAPVRLVVRAFVAVSLVIALARTVPWNRLIAGLRKSAWIALAVVAVLSPIGLLATGDAWGEWGAEDFMSATGLNYVPQYIAHGFSWDALLPDYSLQGLPDIAGYILSAVIGIAVLTIVFRLLALAVSGNGKTSAR